jgi:hypothetical protein
MIDLIEVRMIPGGDLTNPSLRMLEVSAEQWEACLKGSLAILFRPMSDWGFECFVFLFGNRHLIKDKDALDQLLSSDRAAPLGPVEPKIGTRLELFPSVKPRCPRCGGGVISNSGGFRATTQQQRPIGHILCAKSYGSHTRLSGPPTPCGWAVYGPVSHEGEILVLTVTRT